MRGIDRLLCRFEGDALFLQHEYDILQIFDATCKTVNTGDDKCVSPPRKIQQNLQFSPALPACAVRFLCPDHLAAGSVQSLFLQREVLIAARNKGIFVERHNLNLAG